MKIKLGLIGVEDTLEFIQSIIDEYSEFSCLPLVHSSEEEIIEQLSSHADDVDLWLFSGYLPYSTAKKWGKVNKPMFYIPYTGSSLYKTLYDILFTQNITINELSFDVFNPDELKQIFDELNMEYHSTYLDPFYLDQSSDHSGVESSRTYLDQYVGTVNKFIQHHCDLWKKKQTRAAVTCVWAVHSELERLGIPAFRVTPAKSAIKSILNMILRTHEMLRFKDTQIAVQMFEIDPFFGLSKGMYSSDEIYNIEIKTTQKLLKYAKKVEGSLKNAGPGRYVIFTTRGALSDMTNRFTVAADIGDIFQIGKDAATCGIGTGNSAYEAEINAGKALLNAKEYGEGTWIVFFEDKTINGPLGSSDNIIYSYASEELQEISKETSLSVSTLSKLDAILKKADEPEMTAHELAHRMQIMPRSARRIIASLQIKGYVQVIGEENPHPRGRPRKIYRFYL